MQPRLNEPISQAGSVHAQVTGSPDEGVPTSMVNTGAAAT
jgi:hypothetical protein